MVTSRLKHVWVGGGKWSLKIWQEIVIKITSSTRPKIEAYVSIVQIHIKFLILMILVTLAHAWYHQGYDHHIPSVRPVVKKQQSDHQSLCHCGRNIS